MNYYCSTDGSTVIGPHSLDELRELHQSGVLPPTTQVCREDEVAWQPLSAILTSEQDIPSAGHSSPERDYAHFVSDLQKHGGQIEVEGEVQKKTATPPPAPQQGNAWYYAQDGTRLGPINEDQIRKLIAAHTIRRDSLVWCEGLADWTPAQQTDIRHFFGSTTGPPPLTGESVNNGIVWTVAFAPILAGFLKDYLAEKTQYPRSGFWWVALALNIGLCLADQRKLKDAGHDTKGMTAWAVLVPVYLFVRASRLKQSNGYAFVWLATFFISLLMNYWSNSSSGTSSSIQAPSSIQVLDALYGTGSQQQNVTAKLRSLVQSRKPRLRVGTELFGTTSTTNNTLSVAFSRNGQLYQIELRDGEPLSFANATPVSAYHQPIGGSEASFTASATPQPSTVSQDLRVEPDPWMRTGEFGGHVIGGSVLNFGRRTYSYVQVSFNLYDREGNQVGSTFANVNNLEPGKSWNFKAPVLQSNAVDFKLMGVSGF